MTDMYAHTITVEELIEMLMELPKDAIVVMSEDAEGNGFSPFTELSVGSYEADTTYSGEFYVAADDDDDDAYVPVEGRQSVALWPVN